jgi:N-acylneuraminate cytidylyltransferase
MNTNPEIRRLAIIPARGGSKRIPGKNIRPFLGKPIIAYSIETAVTSGLFDEVMVSTDSEEIAEVAGRYGAKVPFWRSAARSDDHATLADVALEVLTQYSEKGMEFDYFCCLLPAAPLINTINLTEAFERLVSGNYSSVFPVVKFNYPILRSLKIENEHVSMNWPKFEKSRSQDLPDSFHDAGQFYWMKTSNFMLEKKFFSWNSGAILLNELGVQDIDTETDWLMAELKYKILYNR